MTVKGYIERKIKDIKTDIETAENSFNEYTATENRDYDVISRMALRIKSLQDELKGMQKAFDAIEECEN